MTTTTQSTFEVRLVKYHVGGVWTTMPDGSRVWQSKEALLHAHTTDSKS